MSVFSLSSILSIIALLLTIAATVLIIIFIIPDAKRPRLNKFFKILHDIFNFKSLLLESILKVLYIFSTVYCIFGGFLQLFSFRFYEWTEYNYYTDSYVTHTDFDWNGLPGIFVMLFGPIVVRLIFEASMMFVLLVKNTIQINNKLKNQNPEVPNNSAPKAGVSNNYVPNNNFQNNTVNNVPNNVPNNTPNAVPNAAPSNNFNFPQM